VAVAGSSKIDFAYFIKVSFKVDISFECRIPRFKWNVKGAVRAHKSVSGRCYQKISRATASFAAKSAPMGAEK
jgi:hypothetical protein